MEIRDFYERFPYPSRRPDDVGGAPALPSDFDVINHHLFAGAWPRTRPVRILVAGGGSGDAAVSLGRQLAQRGTPFHIHCVDLSQSSLELARARAEHAGVADHVAFERRSIEDLGAGDRGLFDYIDFCGVLNHVADQAESLEALRRLLATGGGIGVMAYGALGRTGIYPIQDALRRLGMTDAGSLPAARRLVADLPESHWARRNPILRDLARMSDTEFADLFLNPRDRAFSVSELMALFGGAGLRIATFLPPLVYEPRALLADADTRRRLDLVDRADRWQIAEDLQGNLAKHVFLATSTADPPPAIDFADPAYRAVFRGDTAADTVRAITGRAGERVDLTLAHDGQARPVAVRFSGLECRVLTELHAGRRFGDIAASVRDEDPRDVTAALGRVCRMLASVCLLHLVRDDG